MTPSQMTAAIAVPLSVALIGAVGKIVLDARKRAAEDVRRATERNTEAMTVRRLLAFAAGVKPDDLTMAMVQSLINSQSNTVEGMRSMVRSVPHPFLCWAKERVSANRYHMLDFNESFRSVIVGGPREIYIGKRDREVFFNDDADLFERNDERAYQAGPQAVSEPFLSELTGAKGTFEGVKWHLEVGDRQILFGLGSWIADGQLTFPLNHTGD